MRDLLIVLLSAVFFFLVFISVFLGIQNNIYRLPVYFLPNGQIINVDRHYQQYWGHKISIEDVEFARDLNAKFNFAEHEVRIYKKNENVKIGNFFFFHIKKTELVYLFIIDIISSLIAFITAVLFFYSIRDNFIFLFFSALSGLFFANFLYLAFEQYYSVLIFLLYTIGFMIWNLSYRFRGKEIPTSWTIPQIILAGIMGFIVQTEAGDNAIYVKIASGGLILILLSTIVSILWILHDILRFKNLSNITNRKLSLLFSLSILLFVPVTFLFDDPLSLLQYHRSLILIFFVIFLASFIFGTYKYSFVPMQVFFSPTTVTILLVVTILGNYAIFVYILNEYLNLQILSDSRYFNIFYLFITIFYLIPLRNIFRIFVNYWSFKKNPHLSKSLDRITSLISSPISVKSIVGTINRSMMEAMNVTQIAILIPGDQFPNVDLKNINFTRISSNSDIWNYFKNLKEVTVTSHLAYGVGFREKLYSYLNKMEIQIAFPVRDSKKTSRNKAILLIGEKINKNNFSLGELRYIREVSRLASMLIDNYELLADEIEKKKIQRKIQIASILDHTLNLIDQNHSNKLRIGYFSIPAVEISGDYIDFINLNQDKTAIFLGDVSGHGLGTGYIVTAIKAIIRDLTQQDESLESIFRSVNDFLIRKYGGNEFMTLLGGVLDTKKQKFTYVNAGHPGLIVIESDGNLKFFNKTQRVLGILATDYRTQELDLNFDEKLVLYSDGVTETFGESDLMFGDESLHDFLKTQCNLSASELPILLEQNLDNFRREKELSDDTSFIAIELLS
jgi:serine phosphatase RsbU (regulator of sigma subunit)